MIVVDASVLANAIGDDTPEGVRVREALREGAPLAAPDLVDVETVSVLRRRYLDGTISEARFSTAIDDLALLEVDRYPTLRFMRRAFELRSNVTPYDAVYVALAEALNCELITSDGRLAKAPGPRCRFRVLN